MGVQNEPLLICRILNGHISATGDPIHFMFGSRVGFSGSADQMALFPVRSNPGWRPAAILENYSDIARFPRDSVDFFFDLLFFSIRAVFSAAVFSLTVLSGQSLLLIGVFPMFVVYGK